LFFRKDRWRTRSSVVSEQGKEPVVAILGPGQFFGEGCLNGHPLRIATTRAMDECVVTRLEKATMIATIHDEPEFSELLPEPIVGTFSQETLTEMIGTTRSRVSFFLKKFRNWVYRIQRETRGPQFLIERDSVRQARDPNECERLVHNT
jgi:CRP/FNR family cyclic AMP-dependent transcriptional regulator